MSELDILRLAMATATCYFVPGHLILSLLRSKNLNTADSILASIAISLLVTTCSLVFSSFASIPFVWTVSALSVAAVILEAYRFRNIQFSAVRARFVVMRARARNYLASLSWLERALFVVVVYQSVVYMTQDLYWPIYGWDALGYWMYLGRAFFEEGTMHLAHHQLWMGADLGTGSAYPLMLPLLYAWHFTSASGLDQVLASSVQMVFLLVLIIVVFQLFRDSSEPLPFLACLCLLLFNPVVAVQFDSYKGYADFPLFVSNVTLIYFVLRFWQSPSNTNVFLAGVIAGLAAGVKQLGLVFALLGGTLVLLKQGPQGQIGRVKSFLTYGLTALGLFGPYYIYPLTQASSQIRLSYSPSSIDLSKAMEFARGTLGALDLRYTPVWGLAPIIALIGIFLAAKHIQTRIVLYWIVGSTFLFCLFVSTTPLGSAVWLVPGLYDPRYALPIFGLFALLGARGLGIIWQKARSIRGFRGKILSILVVVVLVGNSGVLINIGYGFWISQGHSLPPFISQSGSYVQRDLDQKYNLKLGGFYNVSMYINERTEPDSAILIPSFYRWFFFNARDQRILCGLDRGGLWTRNLTELRTELRGLGVSHIYLVEEPWYRTHPAYQFYYETALYVHRQEIMTVRLRTNDGYVLYQIDDEFFMP